VDVFIIYQFCTFGGVERVLLNRAKAFKENNLDVKITAGYLYDSGALDSFKTYVTDHGLDDFISAVILDQNSFPNLEKYDYIFVIDTPQVFEQLKKAKNVFVECHTHYIENRQYLRRIPTQIKGIIVPSKSFKDLIQSEFPKLPPISVLPNPVPMAFFDVDSIHIESAFDKRIITYFGRLDELKNFNEAFKIFEGFVDNETLMYAVVGNGATQKDILRRLADEKMLRKSLIRENIGFDDVPYLIKLVKQHCGVYLSPSKGESFGLSVAEFMSGGVPVLLSDISAHRDLVENDERFLYPLGDISAAKQKMDFLLQNWKAMSAQITIYAEKFDAHTFIAAWDKFLAQFG
jgi:glycosyltransferase involved in cell wall biosynthesis